MPQFRKKPVVIDAIQWDGTLSGMIDIRKSFPEIETLSTEYNEVNNSVNHWKIGTLEGSHYVSPLDFVIKGVKGEFYPCKPDIFLMSYEPVLMDEYPK